VCDPRPTRRGVQCVPSFAESGINSSVGRRALGERHYGAGSELYLDRGIRKLADSRHWRVLLPDRFRRRRTNRETCSCRIRLSQEGASESVPDSTYEPAMSQGVITRVLMRDRRNDRLGEEADFGCPVAYPPKLPNSASGRVACRAVDNSVHASLPPWRVLVINVDDPA
jgi:hypothetical protein